MLGMWWCCSSPSETSLYREVLRLVRVRLCNQSNTYLLITEPNYYPYCMLVPIWIALSISQTVFATLCWLVSCRHRMLYFNKIYCRKGFCPFFCPCSLDYSSQPIMWQQRNVLNHVNPCQVLQFIFTSDKIEEKIDLCYFACGMDVGARQSGSSVWVGFQTVCTVYTEWMWNGLF